MPRASQSRRPLFQRRQYQFIADVLKHAQHQIDARIDPAGLDRLDRLTRSFADRLEHTNMHFNRTRFLDACREDR